ncbi:MAG: lasso peptide biosynthesis B2 protein [Erythrobacter sp.]|uniref:lasso peptide biosynthesis B2 protein n=1 Tax=Erythrobacter sp. TaxID=1042 RepID=UPI001B1BEAC5|nr:lasso peptide biosynthesis B2 protein [Erythrobacter sp.]MBO6767374.1 lasso peptide biosynthesis B2 protein [Erythrobacter sp.]
MGRALRSFSSMIAPELDQPDIAWCRIGNQIIFLDIANDRYFRLSEDRNCTLIESLIQNGGPQWHQPPRFPLPADWSEPAASAKLAKEFRLGLVAKALWVQRRIEKRIASRSLVIVLDELRDLISRRTQTLPELSAGGEAMVQAFEQAKLIRTAADRCLPRSIALAICLASLGDRSSIVIGVRTPPFGAHCWAQKGSVVLNDSLEEVRRFEPILVV